MPGKISKQSPLSFEGRIAAANYASKDTLGLALACANLIEPLLDRSVSPTEAFEHLEDVARTSGDVIVGTIGVHDSQRISVDLALHPVLVLIEESRRIHHDTRNANIKAVAVKIEELL